jgi:hypothetical protein
MLALKRSSRRGAILIVVLGVLAVLALLATTFATLQATERNIAHCYLDTVRARMVAESGVQAAVAKISELAGRGQPGHLSMQYWGNNLTETGAPDWAVPLEFAQNPSFAWEDELIQDPTDANVRPLQVSLDGRAVGFSGMMGNGSYATHGDLYRLRVADCNSMIYLNDGLENGTTGHVSQNLKRILNNLGDVISVPGAGDRILAARPPWGYRDKRELAKLFSPGELLKIRPFVTTFAWVDKDVANPVPISRETLNAYPVRYGEKLGIYRYGRSFGSDGHPIHAPLLFAPEYANPLGSDHAIMALDEVNAQWIEVCRRAPVNVNLAPKEILTALIVGLRGVFVAERRKQNPSGDMYSILFHSLYDNVPGGRLGDEYGFLYSTVPFIGSSGTTTGGILASRVADEIIACRTKAQSPGCPGRNYGTLWYGGPFKTWRQFNAFCDGLVSGGLLRDDRQIYFDYESQSGFSGQFNGPDTLIHSPLQAKFAAQALADTLKANFNPNLALNEANPDANLYLIVDKTDLLSNSTEFCFTPMGVFEIECEGLVVRTPAEQDLLICREGTVWAREKICSVAQVYDVHRESAQAEFHAPAGKSSPPPAGGDVALVLGPEPDVAPLPQECRWGGWLQLAPVGDSAGGQKMGEVLRGHFNDGFDLKYHAGNAPKPLRPRSGDCRNNPDRTEAQPGPYGPGVGAVGQYRLARSFQEQDPAMSQGAAAASDLRVDGAYVERDSALMYQNGVQVLGMQGTVAYWIKPSFHPEMSGKPRTFFSVDRVLPLIYKGQPTGNTGSPFFLILAQWFFPTHDAPPGQTSPSETAPPVYSSGPWRPISMLAGYSTWGGVGGGMGVVSTSLNHSSHADTMKTDILAHHSWIHVAFQWDMVAHVTRLAINGRVVSGGANDIKVHPQNNNSPQDYIPVPLRFGEPSKVPVDDHNRGRNWAADATVDELYLWKSDMLSGAQRLYSRGRYQLPRPGSQATFTSQPVTLLPASERTLAPPCRGDGPSTTMVAGGPPCSIRVLHVAWTWYPEFVDAQGLPKMRDRRMETDLAKGREIAVQTEMRLLLNDAPQDLLTKDGGSSPVNFVIQSGDKFQYRLAVRFPDATLDTVLTATPIIDDVTIYFTAGTRFLSYYLDRVAS